jgi:hypothetical protein
MTELPFAKQPPTARVLGSGALLAQFEISAEELAGVVCMREIPAVDEQEAPPLLTVLPAPTVNPEQ